MKTTLSKDEIAKELFLIIQENTVSTVPLEQLNLKSLGSENFLRVSPENKDYYYMICNESNFFSLEERELEDDIFLIDCYKKEGFLDFEQYFNITGQESMLEMFCRMYDDVYAIYQFAYGNKPFLVKRPQTIDDLLYYMQYDGDNYCFLIDLDIDKANSFDVTVFPVVNLQKRTIEIDYRIRHNYNEFGNYQEGKEALFNSVILAKLGKTKEELTPDDSTVLQMLNV